MLARLQEPLSRSVPVTLCPPLDSTLRAPSRALYKDTEHSQPAQRSTPQRIGIAASRPQLLLARPSLVLEVVGHCFQDVF